MRLDVLSKMGMRCLYLALPVHCFLICPHPQDKQEEVETLQAELASSKQEKANQKSRVSELRSVLKASVQHHKVKVLLLGPLIMIVTVCLGCFRPHYYMA